MKKIFLPLVVASLLLVSCQTTSGATNRATPYNNTGTVVPTLSEKDKCIAYFKKVNNYSTSLNAYRIESVLLNDYDSSSDKRVTETADFFYYDQEGTFSIAIEMKIWKGSSTSSDTPFFSQYVTVNFSFQKLATTYKGTELFTYKEPGYDYLEFETVTNCVFTTDGKMSSCSTTRQSSNFPSKFSTTISNDRQKTCDYFNLSVSWVNLNCATWGFAQPW